LLPLQKVLDRFTNPMKRLVSLLISVLILAVIYWKIDFRGLLQVFQQSNGGWMTLSLGMVLPITVITAWRLQQLLPPSEHPTQQPLTPSTTPRSGLGFAESNRLILLASTLNMVLPSKMGDIAKAYFIRQRGHLSGSLSLSLVVFEKACDLLSLLLWCAFGLLLYPHKDWLFWGMTIAVLAGLGLGSLLLGSKAFARLLLRGGQSLSRRFQRREGGKAVRSKLTHLENAWGEMHDYFWGDRRQLLKITVISMGLWFLHLVQIWLFILALNAWTPFLTNLALSPLAILAGLLPLTFAGVGTRDAALILFYQPYFNAQTAAALGILCTSRYLIPAIAGLPFLGHYLSTARPPTHKVP